MVNVLPVIDFRGKPFFFDERLGQLRNVYNPHDYVDLDEVIQDDD
jgi:hypothetical protein